MQAVLDAFLFQHFQDVGRHRQRVRGDEVEAVAFELGQRLGERVHGAAVLQVADHGDAEVVQAALGFLDGEQIQQGLGRVLVGAVAGVEHRHVAGEFSGHARRAFLRMAHHDGIHVGADHRDGVGQGFAFLAE